MKKLIKWPRFKDINHQLSKITDLQNEVSERLLWAAKILSKKFMEDFTGTERVQKILNLRPRKTKVDMSKNIRLIDLILMGAIMDSQDPSKTGAHEGKALIEKKDLKKLGFTVSEPTQLYNELVETLFYLRNSDLLLRLGLHDVAPAGNHSAVELWYTYNYRVEPSK